MTGAPQDDREALTRAFVTVSRYSADISDLAVQSLGRDDIENRDIQILLAIHGASPVTPTGVAATTGTAPSVVSRALRRLERAGLVARTRDIGDRRSVLVTVTGKGRRRVLAFAGRLADYFAAGEPLLKDMFQALELPVERRADVEAVDPLAAAAEMSRVGAGFLEDADAALEPFGVRQFADRFALVLIFQHGHERPSQIADELGFTLSGTSGLLTRLETAGLITRQHDATVGDRRAVKLELTERGEEAVLVLLSVFAHHAASLGGALSLTMRSRYAL